MKCLGVFLDCELSFCHHVSKTVASCFSTLRCLNNIRRFVPRQVLISLVVSLVFTRLDYCGSILYGSPLCLFKRLQRVINAAARMVCRSSRFSHITPLLHQLGWLSISDRVTLRLAILGHSALRGALPNYLSDMIRDVSSVSSRYSLRSNASRSLVVPLVKRPTLGGRSFPEKMA